VTEPPPNPEPSDHEAGDVPAAIVPDPPTVAPPAPEVPRWAAAASESVAAPEPPTAPAPPVPPVPPSLPDTASAPPVPAPEPAPVWAAPPDAEGAGAITPAAGDRPELAVGAAFAGGFIMALILKRLAR
jgi:hypothetical protein